MAPIGTALQDLLALTFAALQQVRPVMPGTGGPALISRVIRRKTKRRNVIGDHHGRARGSNLLIRAGEHRVRRK